MFSHRSSTVVLPLLVDLAVPPTRLAVARRALVEASREAGLAQVPANDTEMHRTGVLATGLPAIDAALGGGLPRGRIVEVTGARSSGRWSLALGLLGRALASGEPVVLVDAADALDPRSLPEQVRARVLWVRAGDAVTALRATDLVLDGGGFSLVVVHLAGASATSALSRSRNAERVQRHASRAIDPAHTSGLTVGVTGREAVTSASWARIAQRAARSRTSVLVVRDEHARGIAPVGAFAHAVLATERVGVRWQGGGWLEAVDSRVTIARAKQRTGSASEAGTAIVLRAE